MIRIGIVGTESSHPKAFLKWKDFIAPEFCIAAVLEEGDGAGHALAQEFSIPQAVPRMEEMIPLVDAVMIFYRSAQKHYEVAKACLEQGISVWLDKPFTQTVSQAKELYMLARQKGLTIDGVSSLRFCRDVQNFANCFQNTANILSGSFNYPSMADSPYDGIMFYGPHSMTLLMELFGEDVKGMSAMKQKSGVLLLARYENFMVSIQMVDCWSSFAEAYLEKDVIRKELRFEDVYKSSLLNFCHLLKLSKQEKYETLIGPVALLTTLRASLESGKEVSVEAWKEENISC